MEVSEAREIINGSDWLTKIKWSLHLQEWNILFKWERLGEGKYSDKPCVGRCQSDVAYREATIEIDPWQHDSAEELKKTVRHELIHIVLADIETFRLQAYMHISDDTTRVSLDVAWDYGLERIIGNLERIFDLQLGLGPDEMVERAEKAEEAKRLFVENGGLV